MTPTPNVIQFNCQSCGTPLTVPASMAGVSGPCPYCRATITSPQATLPTAPASPFTAPHPSLMLDQGQGQLPASLPIQGQPPAPQQMPQQAQPQPAVSPWLQGASPAPLPGPSPVLPGGDGMTGATWPPAATVVRGSGAHPVMDRLLHTPSPLPAAAPSTSPSPLPTVTPPYQERSNTPPKRRMSSSSREGGKKGAMWLAVFMAVLVLAGTSWFFRDQLKAAWLSYTLKDDDSGSTSPDNGGAAANFDPSAKPPIKAIPIPIAPAVPPPSNPPDNANGEPITVRPAMPAPNSQIQPQPSAPGGLVEVSGAPPSPGPPVNVIPPAPIAPSMVSGITTETQPALEALQKFFQAKTWEERLPLVQAPKSMRPLMEQYYKTNPDGPLYPSHLQMMRHDTDPETGPPHCVFNVAGGGLKQPIPVMVESTDSGWKVDWLTFTEFKDELLLKFLESPQPEPARFHVLMRRAHYFEDDVPALDKKSCFQIMAPMPHFRGDVFALKGSPVSRELDKFLPWDVHQGAAVVELQWRKEERYQWVELTNLVQLNWRNVEPSELTNAGEAKPPSPGNAPGRAKGKESAKSKEPVPPKVVPVE